MTFHFKYSFICFGLNKIYYREKKTGKAQNNFQLFKCLSREIGFEYVYSTLASNINLWLCHKCGTMNIMYDCDQNFIPFIVNFTEEEKQEQKKITRLLVFLRE